MYVYISTYILIFIIKSYWWAIQVTFDFTSVSWDHSYVLRCYIPSHTHCVYKQYIRTDIHTIHTQCIHTIHTQCIHTIHTQCIHTHCIYVYTVHIHSTYVHTYVHTVHTHTVHIQSTYTQCIHTHSIYVHTVHTQWIHSAYIHTVYTYTQCMHTHSTYIHTHSICVGVVWDLIHTMFHTLAEWWIKQVKTHTCTYVHTHCIEVGGVWVLCTQHYCTINIHCCLNNIACMCVNILIILYICTYIHKYTSIVQWL